jgi:hypothetical protein
MTASGANWPEAECLLLVARYGKADTHYQIWVGTFRPVAAVSRTIAERRDLTRSGGFK